MTYVEMKCPGINLSSVSKNHGETKPNWFETPWTGRDQVEEEPFNFRSKPNAAILFPLSLKQQNLRNSQENAI